MTYGLGVPLAKLRDPAAARRAYRCRRREHTMIASLTDPKTKHFDHAPLGTDEAGIEGQDRRILNRHPAVGLAVGVVRNGRLEFFSSHGVADIVEHARHPGHGVSDRVDHQDLHRGRGAAAVRAGAGRPGRAGQRLPTRLPADPGQGWAPAGDGAPAADPHRRAAPAGAPWRAFTPILGETVRFGQPLPTLAEFYRGGLHLVAEPGTRCTYSNHGVRHPRPAGRGRGGTPWTATSASIFEPLAMADTDLVRSERVRSRLATGYRLRSDGPHPVGDWDVICVGAGSIYSTTTDMARYVAALLGGAPGSTARSSNPRPWPACSPHYRPDPRIPGIGLAFFRDEVGGHLVVEHEGLLPGFSSQLSLAPDDGVGVVAFTNGAKSASAWLGTEVSGLLSDVLGMDQGIGTEVPHHPEFWGELCGWYGFRGSFRDVQRWLVLGAEVVVRRGQLMLRALSPIPALNRGLARSILTTSGTS